MSGEVERLARLLIQQRGISPETLYEHHEWDDLPCDERVERVDPFSGEPRVTLMHRAWRKRVKDAEQILAHLATRTPSDADRTAVVEECARVAEDEGGIWGGHPYVVATSERIAAAIRRLSTPAGEDRP